jgi:hypothetical protein
MALKIVSKAQNGTQLALYYAVASPLRADRRMARRERSARAQWPSAEKRSLGRISLSRFMFRWKTE